jgi:two-component system, NtrC family, sensor kinase
VHDVGNPLSTRGLLQKLRARLRRSLRAKLLALAVLPLLLAVPVLVGILWVWGNIYFDQLLINKVRSDLAVANGYFVQVRKDVGYRVEALAASEKLARALRERASKTTVTSLLAAAQKELGVDFLVLIDAQGKVRFAGGDLSPGLVYALPEHASLQNSSGAVTSVRLMSSAQLAAIDPALAARAGTPLLPTLNARPSQQTEEIRGMVMHAVAHIPSGGFLAGGLLLNRNLDFVDRINDIVYPEGALPLGSVGTTTLFLDDVRIATNVRLFEGERAIGTRVSAAVRDAVLEQGRTWLDRAFVVNDWFVSAYEPIVDADNQRIGMLYVGFLETPFKSAKKIALGSVVALFLLVIAVVVLISLRMARRVSAPVEQMHGVMNAIEAGAEDTRVGRIETADELAELASHFDRLLDRLALQTDVLQRWGAELDSKVAERTYELAAANQSLRSAQQRLVLSEKLAAIGQLAAGVAHEINNPVAVIQGNLDVLRDILGERAAPVMTEIRLIQDQVFRIRLIVTKLLQFARPTEYAGYMEAVSLDQVIQDSLVLVGHQLQRTQIAVVQELHATRPVQANRNELQQVLINLIVNALQAMQGIDSGATLLLSSGDRDEVTDQGTRRGSFVTVGDSGPGIRAEDRARLFEPFFTTKTNEGTGLGLWISLGLVERYGGRISVDCPAQGGTVFTVWLPSDVPAEAVPESLVSG